MLFIQLLFNGLAIGAAAAPIALGFAIIYGNTRVFHVAHGAVYTSAAYVLYSLYQVEGWPLEIAILIAVLFSSLLGVLIETCVYYPLRSNPNRMIVIISSLGINTVIINVLSLIYGNGTQQLQSGFDNVIAISDFIMRDTQLLKIAGFLLVVSLLLAFLKWTHQGNLIRAFSIFGREATKSQDLESQNWFGINPRIQRIWVFAIGSALAGFGACLQAIEVGVNPYVGFNVMLVSVVATIIGTAGVYFGAIAGSFIISITQSLIVWQFSAKWQSAAAFIVLLLFLVFRPQGLFAPQQRVEHEE